MTPQHKRAREMLKRATRGEFEKILKEAKVPSIYETVARLHLIDGLTLYQIAAKLHIAERTARKYLSIVYDRTF